MCEGGNRPNPHELLQRLSDGLTSELRLIVNRELGGNVRSAREVNALPNSQWMRFLLTRSSFVTRAYSSSY